MVFWQLIILLGVLPLWEENKMKKIIIFISISIIIVILICFVTRTSLFKQEVEISVESLIDINQYEDELTREFFNIMATHQESNWPHGEAWTLPDFEDWSCSEIAFALKNIEQPYEIVYENKPSKQHNVIISQKPNAGEKVTRDDIITLYVNGYYGCRLLYKKFALESNKIVECGEWIYYINNDSNIIYKSRIDLSKKTQIYASGEKEILGIIAKEDTIYFNEVNREESTGQIIKIDNDGNKKSVLIDINFTYLYFMEDYHIFYYDPTKGTVCLYNIKTNEVTEAESAYGYFYRYAVFSTLSAHFLGDSNFLYSLGKDIDVSDEDGKLSLLEPYKNGELNKSNAMFEHDLVSGETTKIFETNGKALEIIEYGDRWIVAESVFGGIYTNWNGEVGDIYSYDKTSKKRKLIDSHIYRYGSDINMAIWKNYLFNISANENLFLYNLDTNEKTYIQMSKDKGTVMFTTKANIIGNYAYLSHVGIMSRLRYNILTGEFEQIEFEIIK